MQFFLKILSTPTKEQLDGLFFQNAYAVIIIKSHVNKKKR